MLRGPTILVVDDELASRKALRKIIVGAGYQFVEASSGAEALQRISAHTLRDDDPGSGALRHGSVRSHSRHPAPVIYADHRAFDQR
jgi:CheY-like chemotaxis protein